MKTKLFAVKYLYVYYIIIHNKNMYSFFSNIYIMVHLSKFMKSYDLKILSTFLENEKRKEESNNDEVFLKCNTRFKWTLVRISQVQNSSIDYPLPSENYRGLLNEQ